MFILITVWSFLVFKNKFCVYLCTTSWCFPLTYSLLHIIYIYIIGFESSRYNLQFCYPRDASAWALAVVVCYLSVRLS